MSVPDVRTTTGRMLPDETEPKGGNTDNSPAKLARSDEVVGQHLHSSCEGHSGEDNLANFVGNITLRRLEHWARTFVRVELAVQNTPQERRRSGEGPVQRQTRHGRLALSTQKDLT
eukprot:2661258-Rhodomonas_salina.2